MNDNSNSEFQNIVKYLSELSKKPQLSFTKYPAPFKTLDNFYNNYSKLKWTTPSQNLWGVRMILRSLKDDELVDFLRDGLAEMIERLQKQSSVPLIFSQFLWLIAAIEEDLAGRSPLRIKYCDYWKIAESSDYITNLMMSASFCFLKRAKGNREQILNEMREIVDDCITEQNSYLKFLRQINQRQNDSNENLENEDENLIEPSIKNGEELLFEIYAVLLDFPNLLYKFLLWYYFESDSNIEPKTIIKELKDIARFLLELGYSNLSIFPFEFSLLLPKIMERSIRDLYLGVFSNDIQNFFRRKGIYELWPPQLKMIQKIKNLNNSYFIVQPTGSGKSLIAQFWVYLQIKNSEDQQIIYIVPSKALAYQATKDLKKTFNDYDITVSNLSGIQLHPILDMARRRLSNILVMTPEKFNFLYQNGEFIRFIPTAIVIDEAHIIFGHNIRNFKSALLLLKIRLRLASIPVLALSGVMENPDIIKDWKIIKVNYIKSTWRSTRLKVFMIDITNNFAIPYYDDLEEGWDNKLPLPALFKSFKDRKEHVATLVKHYLIQPEYQSAIIFCNSRNNAEDIAKKISIKMNKRVGNKSLIQKRKNLSKIISSILGNDSTLIELIKSGVAFHHAGMPIELRDILLDALNNRTLNVISATTTLAEGLNTPADIVVIPYTHFYDKILKNTPYSMSLIKNMIGRAGRAEHGGVGLSFIYTSNIKKYRNLEPKNKLDFISNFSQSFGFQEKIFSEEINAANYKIPEILQFRPALFSLVCEKLIDTYKPNIFIKKLDMTKKSLFKNQIIETIDSFKNLKNLLVETSPMKPTNQGWTAYQTGLDPFSFNNTILYINSKLHTIKPILEKPFLQTNSDEKSIILKLFFVPDESRVPKEHLIEVKHRLKLLNAWINSNGSLLMAKDGFLSNIRLKQNKNSYDIFKISTTIFGELTETIPWTAWSILQILQNEYQIKIHPSYSLIPLYIRGGTLDPIRAILNAFQISPEIIDKIYDFIPKEINNDLDISLLFNWIINDLMKLIKAEFKEIEDLGLIELVLLSKRFKKDQNKTLFLATFYAGWLELALNALKSLKIDDEKILKDLVLDCLDFILRNYKEYKELELQYKSINTYFEIFKVISDRNELKGHSITQFEILKNLFQKYKHYNRYIEKIERFLN